MYSFEQWLAAAEQQPELPDDLPEWLEDLVTFGREGDVYQSFTDQPRRVPKVDEQGNEPRYSAVLVLIGDEDPVPGSDLRGNILLTHRAPTMRTHSGQMAFPGGAREAQDSGPIATALREANEETGLDPDSVQPLAIVSPLYIQRTNFAVIPVLAYWKHPHEVYPASPESDWVHTVPLGVLANPETRFMVEFNGWSGPAFHVENMVLWGFTGGLVNTLLRRAGWEQSWDETRTVDLFSTLERSANGEQLAQMKQNFTGERDR